MIPKVIHYCWFGGNEMSALEKKCIESWKTQCPDYEIIRWDETNYDVTKNLYMQQAYAAKKWAFVSDYARLDILYQHGGFYLDTDVELLQSLDAQENSKICFHIRHLCECFHTLFCHAAEALDDKVCLL